MTEICTMFGILYQSVPTNGTANNSAVGLMSLSDAIGMHLCTRLKGFKTESACSFKYKYQVGSSGNRSHPCFVIMDQLEFLQSKHFR